MKKLAILGFVLILLCFCSSKTNRVEKTIEKGVEVVLNHLKPYKVKGEPSTLNLERIRSIDTEKDAIAEEGLTDIFSFDVDSEGNMYILRPPAGPGSLIFKFSEKGEFVTSFGRMGQGPNEMEYPNQILVVAPDRVWVTESPKNKYHIFGSNGTPLGDRTASPGFDTIVPLENGAFLVSRLVAEDMKARYFPVILSLCGSNLQRIKELDRFKSNPNRNIAESLPEKTVSGIDFVFLAKASHDHIYVGNSERGYEILVFDLKGALIRKIRKEYSPVRVSEDYKKQVLKPYLDSMPTYAKKIYFPDLWHPFRSFFCDDDARLFVMTYEAGKNPGESVFDIFNKEGVFIGRQSLNVFCSGQSEIQARIRADRLYCVQEKKTGYKELVVNRMIWK